MIECKFDDKLLSSTQVTFGIVALEKLCIFLKIIKANILPDRERELEAIKYITDQMDPLKVIRPPEEVHIEGGDVMLWNNYIFIGTYKGSDYKDYITARTNWQGVEFIRNLFPNKIVKEFDLVKSKIEARDNALHLDCCFQPVGNDKGN